jgi:hypothetical protein
MVRLGSFLMIVLLATPMARQCCLPSVQVPSCHGANTTGDEPCVSNQQVVVQPSSDNTDQFGKIESFSSDTYLRDSVACLACAADTVAVPHLITDIYLRTGALLI